MFAGLVCRRRASSGTGVAKGTLISPQRALTAWLETSAERSSAIRCWAPSAWSAGTVESNVLW